MADPHAILLVPTEDGASLLALGRLGQRPPCLVSYPKRGPDTQPPWSPYAIPTMDMGYGRVLALPLRWDGELVPEGWDRARRACADLPRGQRPTGPVLMWLHDFRPLCSDVVVLAQFLASAGLCRVVLLDLVDGVLVERAP